MLTAPRIAVWLLVGAWGCLIILALVLAIGPLSVRAIGLSVSHPGRPLAGAVVLGVAALATGRDWRRLPAELSCSRIPGVATFLFVLVLVTLLLVARAAVSVGGADSAGYLAQARLWQQQRLHVPLPLDVPGLPEPAWTQSPLGFRPAPSGAGLVPSYPPGLPWLQAAALATGGEAMAIRGLPWLMTVLALSALFALAARNTGVAAAAVAVVCLATLPAFLFQAMQPMSDVPALALWSSALALAPHRGRGLAAAAVATLVATVVRPNLAFLAVPVAWQAMATADSRGEKLRRLVPIALALTAAGAAVAAVQATLYGSPLQSGYGRASELFSLAHVGSNLTLYPRWFIEATSLPGAAVLIAGAAWLLVRSPRLHWVRPPLLMAGLTLAAYLVYVPFDSWTYLRFILIPLAVATLGVAGLLAEVTQRVPAAWRFPVWATLSLLVAVPNLQQARHLGVFDIRAREYRYEAAGRFLREQVPAQAVLIAAQHSASAPYYSGRSVLRADLLDAASFAAVSRWAGQAGRPLVFVLDTAEAERLRARLRGTELAALDWPPRAEVGRPVTTRVWLSTDRARYHAGEAVPTTRLTSVP